MTNDITLFPHYRFIATICNSGFLFYYYYYYFILDPETLLNSLSTPRELFFFFFFLQTVRLGVFVSF